MHDQVCLLCVRLTRLPDSMSSHTCRSWAARHNTWLLNLIDAERWSLFFSFTCVCSESATSTSSLSPEDFWPALSGPFARGHELSCGSARHDSPCSTAGLSCKLCMQDLAHARLSHPPALLAPPLDNLSARCSMSMVALRYAVIFTQAAGIMQAKAHADDMKMCQAAYADTECSSQQDCCC